MFHIIIHDVNVLEVASHKRKQSHEVIFVCINGSVLEVGCHLNAVLGCDYCGDIVALTKLIDEHLTDAIGGSDRGIEVLTDLIKAYYPRAVLGVSGSFFDEFICHHADLLLHKVSTIRKERGVSCVGTSFRLHENTVRLTFTENEKAMADTVAILIHVVTVLCDEVVIGEQSVAEGIESVFVERYNSFDLTVIRAKLGFLPHELSLGSESIGGRFD